MIQLLLILAPIALIDSISPVRIGAMVTILVTDRPFRRARAFLASIFLGYALLGLTFALGGQWLLEINLVLDPVPVNFVIGLVIGIALILVGLRGLMALKVEAQVEVDQKIGPAGAFLMGLTITIATAPTSIPLLAAVNQILTADVSPFQAYLALAFYCAVFVVPLVILMVQRAVLGERAKAVMKRLGAGSKRWMGRLMAVLFILLGLANVIDALGFFLFDRPLF